MTTTPAPTPTPAAIPAPADPTPEQRRVETPDPAPTPPVAPTPEQQAAEAAVAAEAAALDHGPPPFTLAGVALTMPASGDDLPIAAADAFEKGRALEAMRRVFGPDFDRALAALEAELGRPPKIADIRELSDALALAIGVEPGE